MACLPDVLSSGSRLPIVDGNGAYVEYVNCAVTVDVAIGRIVRVRACCAVVGCHADDI